MLKLPPPKKLVALVIAACAVLGLVAYRRAQSERERLENEKYRAERERIKESVSEFATRYNADRNWVNLLPKQGPGSRLYSADLTPLLIRDDGRPVLLLARIKDITMQGDKYFLHMTGTVGRARIEYVLECNPELAKRETAIRPKSFERFVVVASIQALHTVENADSETAFVANAHCLALLSLCRSFSN